MERVLFHSFHVRYVGQTRIFNLLTASTTTSHFPGPRQNHHRRPSATLARLSDNRIGSFFHHSHFRPFRPSCPTLQPSQPNLTYGIQFLLAPAPILQNWKDYKNKYLFIIISWYLHISGWRSDIRRVFNGTDKKPDTDTPNDKKLIKKKERNFKFIFNNARLFSTNQFIALHFIINY